MSVAQRADSSHVHNLDNLMSSRQMLPLGKPQIANIVHDLCKEPIVPGIRWCVNKTSTLVSPDGQGQEISRSLIDIKVSIHSSRITSSVCRGFKFCLISVVRVEQPARCEQLLQGHASDVLCNFVIDLEVELVFTRIQSADLIGAERKTFHRE